MPADIPEFVAAFQRGWTASSLEMHNELWTDEIELHQPILGSLYGRDECNRAFERMFALTPDLTLDVDGWTGDADSLYISFVFKTTFGGAELRWPAVDRFLLDGDLLIVRRDSLFDPGPVFAHMLRHPRGWGRALKVRLIPRSAKYPPWPGSPRAATGVSVGAEGTNGSK